MVRNIFIPSFMDTRGLAPKSFFGGPAPQNPSEAGVVSCILAGTPSSADTFTMAEKSSSAFSHEESTMIPETSTVGVSFLTNAFKQFANKTVMECIKDGFPASFLHCMYPQAAESSMSLRQSQEGATCRPQMAWVPFLFLHHMESTQMY
jgi:hypothetical protein